MLMRRWPLTGFGGFGTNRDGGRISSWPCCFIESYEGLSGDSLAQWHDREVFGQLVVSVWRRQEETWRQKNDEKRRCKKETGIAKEKRRDRQRPSSQEEKDQKEIQENEVIGSVTVRWRGDLFTQKTIGIDS